MSETEYSQLAYVTYDGNWGTAEKDNFILFNLKDLTEEEDELLENDPVAFFDLIKEKTTRRTGVMTCYAPTVEVLS